MLIYKDFESPSIDSTSYHSYMNDIKDSKNQEECLCARDKKKTKTGFVWSSLLHLITVCKRLVARILGGVLSHSCQSWVFVASDHFRWALTQRRRWRFWIVFTCGYFFAWYSFDLHLLFAQWTVFTDSDFWRRIVSVFNAAVRRRKTSSRFLEEK